MEREAAPTPGRTAPRRKLPVLEPQLYCVSQGQPLTVTLSISQVGKLRLREPKPQATQLPGGRRGLCLCSLMLLGATRLCPQSWLKRAVSSC